MATEIKLQESWTSSGSDPPDDSSPIRFVAIECGIEYSGCEYFGAIGVEPEVEQMTAELEECFT